MQSTPQDYFTSINKHLADKSNYTYHVFHLFMSESSGDVLIILNSKLKAEGAKDPAGMFPCETSTYYHSSFLVS